jgi:hypothetical protein
MLTSSATFDVPFASDITDDLNEGNSGVTIVSNTVNDDIEVIISATVDTSDATGTSNVAEEVSILTQDHGLTDYIVEEKFVTAAPTLIPSISPFTSIPSGAPSFVGLIVSLDISRAATASVDDLEINDFQDLIARTYGVDAAELTTTTEYITTGSISITLEDSTSSEEALDALTDSLASTFGINENDIELEIDLESGEEKLIRTKEVSQLSRLIGKSVAVKTKDGWITGIQVKQRMGSSQLLRSNGVGMDIQLTDEDVRPGYVLNLQESQHHSEADVVESQETNRLYYVAICFLRFYHICF